MRGISDLLSALYGGTEFIMAMLERPDEVKEVARRLTAFWIEFGRLQLGHIPLFQGGVGSFYYNTWAPAGTVWHQEDAAALLSPDLYNEFIRQPDEQIASALDACIMHQHPTRFVPTEFYVNMGFKALELHVDQGGPSAEDLYDRHMQLLQAAPLLIWGNLTPADLDWIFRKLPVAGVAVQAMVENADQAAERWKTYMRD